MQKKKKILQAAALTLVLSVCYSLPVFAVTEAEVQAQVSSAGREAVTGSVFIWFLCAVAFLKVSQKIDSFMSSLGIHVGNTGGSMMAEALVAARGIGAVKSFAGLRGGGGNLPRTGSGAGSGSGGGFFSGGLAGMVNRQITNNAVKSATTAAPSGGPGGLGARLYSSSVSRGGSLANSVISTIATGNIRERGSITGDKAAEALMSYMGYNALEEGAKNLPSFSNVEISGGHITGTETSKDHPEGIAFGMYHADQYAAPQGAYETAQSVDGSSWYKQYAADAVEKSPYKAPDGTVAYNEFIVKKLPPAPPRKERI